MTLHLTVNGDDRKINAGTALTHLITELALSGKRLAVELNGEIVPRSQYETTALNEGDRIEIVQAIGGG